MKKRLESQMTKNERLEGVYKSFQSDIDQIPYLANDYTLLSGYNQLFRKLLNTTGLTTKGLTIQARKDKKAAAHIIFLISNRICQFGIKNKNDDLVQSTNRSLTKLERMSVKNTLATGEKILKIANQNQDNWQQMNITPQIITKLLTTLQHFESSVIHTPHLRLSKKAAHQKIQQLLSQNRQLINNKIVPATKAEFIDTKPQIVDAVKNVLKATKNTFHKRALIGQIIDAETKQPIQNCIIQITQINFKRRVGSQQGRFRIQNLPTGMHIITCTHQHYHTLNYKFIHAWGQTTNITLALKPIKIKQPQPQSIVPTPIQT